MENQAEKQTLTFNRAHGPFVVDVWEPRKPLHTPPVLLIHGWGNSGAYWESTARELSKTNRVIVPDLPGTGRSMPVRSPQNFYEQVSTLTFLVDELGLEQLYIVGHSMGSAMSILLTDARPDAVERLVLTSMCFFTDEAQKQVHKTVMNVSYVAMLFRPSWLADVPMLAKMMGSRYFYRLPDDPELLRQGFLDYLHLDRETAILSGDDARDDTIPEAGARLHLPTLLIACRQDWVMPVANVDHTANIIPDCQVHWIEECGHLPMIEKPAEYLTILRDFLGFNQNESAPTSTAEPVYS
ncbi:alpha/beta fold hydrolase [bacterium]|nr:alpha/beta fold hydrolase [bacterium]